MTYSKWKFEVLSPKSPNQRMNFLSKSQNLRTILNRMQNFSLTLAKLMEIGYNNKQRECFTI